jgi:hypothetical protein
VRLLKPGETIVYRLSIIHALNDGGLVILCPDCGKCKVVLAERAEQNEMLKAYLKKCVCQFVRDVAND